jgi:hypothetical protein
MGFDFAYAIALAKLTACAVSSALVDDPRAAGQRMLGFDFSSFDCRTQRDSAHPELIRSFRKGEPTVGGATFVRGDAMMAARRLRMRCRVAW